jgi:hypothetical protein
MHTPAFAIGGILYIGEPGLVFVPHKANLPRHGGRVSLGPAATVTLRLVPRSPGRVARLLVRALPPLIEAQSEAGGGRFLLPRPEETIRLIEGARRLG